MRLNSSGVVGQRGRDKIAVRGCNQDGLNYKVCDLLAGVTAGNRQPLLDYLREHGPEKFVEKASFRTEEPLKGYRQWVLDGLRKEME